MVTLPVCNSLPFTAGTYYAEGLPNILAAGFKVINSENSPSGAITLTHYSGYGRDGGSVRDAYEARLDASRCSSIYGNSTKVQPLALSVRCYIKF